MITLDSAFVFANPLVVEDFAAELNLISEITQGHWSYNYSTGKFDWIEDETTKWPMHVSSVDDSAYTVTVKFNGAPSGTYAVLLWYQGDRLDADELIITTESTVTAVSPATGSALGGTLVTITGTNFSDEKLDNPVFIGDAACLVETTSATEITCRIEAREAAVDYQDEIAQVSVLLRLSETSVACPTCTFTYVQPSGEVTSDPFDTVEADIDAQVIHFVGDNLCDNGDPILLVDGVAQTLIQPCDDVMFKIVDVSSRKVTNMQFILGDGYPIGHA